MTDAGRPASLLGDTEIRGEVMWVRYRDETSGFGVVELETTDGSDDRVSASGPLADLVDGQHVRLVGRWKEHPTHGRTFDTVFYEQVAPDTVAGMRAFLTSERFREVLTPAHVDRILTVFGRGAGDVIDREPSRLVDEANLPEDVVDDIHHAYVQGRSLADLVTLLEPATIPMSVVRGAHAVFGAGAAERLREEPYDLLEVDRARFAHADGLARHLGIDETDPRRLAAGARAAVGAARRQDGHQLLVREDAVQATMRLLGVDAIAAVAGIDHAVASGTVATDEVAVDVDGDPVAVVATPAALRAERELASSLATLADAEGALVGLDGVGDVELAAELTDGQRAAVATALAHPVSVLTGGPGTGKTRTVAEVVAAAAALGADVALCAPTGRAAKRVEELVGMEASTIHRMLGARPMDSIEGGGGFVFLHDRDSPLGFDLVVVDEVSMCDTSLMRSLVVAIEPGTHLVLVGDADQLPSVGSGNVLADVVASGMVPTTHLDEIHRQAKASRIVSLAREVNAGGVGPLKGIDGDVFMAEEARRDVITARVVEAVATRAPDYFDVEVADIQVIAPMYRGPCGVDALNAALKHRLNPDTGQRSYRGMQVGDRVMVTRNDPELDVSNGDVGTVVDVAGSGAKASLQVQIAGRSVTFDGDSMAELTHAWAITVHKSQGGQWPVVVLVADRSHSRMLRRNLLYTAISRAERALIVVGQAESLAMGARRRADTARTTGLAARLRSLGDTGDQPTSLG